MLHNAYKLKPIIAILAGLVLTVALACAGDSATPTTQPTATSPVGPTETPVPGPSEPRGDWADILVDHPGYLEEWGTPQYGGIYKGSTGGQYNNFPAAGIGYGAWSQWRFSPFNSLLRFDPWLTRNDIIPDLAKSWEISSDGLTYSFVLEEGVLFHADGWGKDLGAPGFGTELTCEDVQHTFERFIAVPEGITTSTWRGAVKNFFTHLDSVSCPDGLSGYTAELKFNTVRSGTLGWLAGGVPIENTEYTKWLDANHPGIRDSVLEGAWESHMGTGPQIPTTHERDVVIKSTSNTDYWREGLPFTDGFEWFYIPDNTTRFVSWASGKVHQFGHGSNGLQPAQVVQAQKQYPDFTVHAVDYYLAYGLLFNVAKPPFDNVKVRKAVHLGIDRSRWEALRKSGTFEGMRYRALLEPGNPFGHSLEEVLEWPGYRQPKDEDLVEANRLLDEVFGEGERPEITCFVRSLATYTDICNLSVQQFERNLNWKININVVDAPSFIEISGRCDYTLAGAITQGATVGADASEMILRWNSETITSYSQCVISEDPDVRAEWDARFWEQDATLDPVKRRELIRSIEFDWIQGYVPVATLGNIVTFWGTRPEAMGAKFFSWAAPAHWPVWERVWLSE